MTSGAARPTERKLIPHLLHLRMCRHADVANLHYRKLQPAVSGRGTVLAVTHSLVNLGILHATRRSQAWLATATYFS